MHSLWGELQKDHFLIVGFTARTGLSAARLFTRFNIPFSISDQKSAEELAPLLNRFNSKGIKVFSGGQDPAQLGGMSKVLLSPGVPRNLPLIKAAVSKGIPVYNDIDLIYPVIADKVVIGVTGTDGKTTTVALMEAVIRTGKKVVACGNNDNPVFDNYDALLSSDAVVLELSSYMLEDLKQFRPHIAVITNIAEDHLDRYTDFTEYQNTKFNLVKYCTPADLFIRNLDNDVTAAKPLSGIRCKTVSARGKADVMYQAPDFITADFSFPYTGCRLKGNHNAENILMALAAAEELGLQPDAVIKAVTGFEPLPHRMQQVQTNKAVQVFNDSKATTIQAVCKAVGSFKERIILLVGGQGKGLDFSVLNQYAEQLKFVVCYGAEGEAIASSLDTLKNQVVDDFTDAVKLQWQKGEPGDVLLLSPGCTSWDQFSDYKERGETYMTIIRELDT